MLRRYDHSHSWRARTRRARLSKQAEALAIVLGGIGAAAFATALFVALSS